MDGRHEGGTRPVRGHGPAGEQARRFRHVGLGIAALYAERMQLQQLARQVLVQPAFAAAAHARLRPDGLRVVQVEQHRRVEHRSAQQIDEAAEGMRTDRLVLVRPDQGRHRATGRSHAEMVGPELGPALGHRCLGGDHVLPAALQAVDVCLAQAALRRLGLHVGLLVGGLQVLAQHLQAQGMGLNAGQQPGAVEGLRTQPLGLDPPARIVRQRLQAGLGVAESVGSNGSGLHGGGFGIRVDSTSTPHCPDSYAIPGRP